MELKKIPAASAPKSAQEWAAKRGLRAGIEDLNQDGLPETVVYNKAGQPIIINGYKLTPSDYAVRNLYYSKHPTSEARAGKPMKAWVKHKAFNTTVNPEQPWKQTVAITPFGEKVKDWGYKLPAKPKKRMSVYQHFSKHIAPYVKEYFDSGAFVTMLGANAGPSCAKLLKKVISPITMYRLLYVKIVERRYFYHLARGDGRGNNMEMTYSNFKTYCKNNPTKYWDFYIANTLQGPKEPEFNQFKPNIINLDVVVDVMVNGEMNWDGSDLQDSILFLMPRPMKASDTEDWELFKNMSRMNS